MITLYAFGPAFGLPDPSPFVMKAEVLLKMAAVPYRVDLSGFAKAPKGKLPYIDDGGMLVADSTFIRRHLEEKHGADFDRGLSDEQRAIAWGFEKMAEDHLYWTIVDTRWCDDANFAKGPAAFFRRIPAPVRPVVATLIRRKVRKSLHAQGAGRHSAEEKAYLASRSVAAIADFLGTKSYFMGSEPTGVDATMYAFAAGSLCPIFDGPLHPAAERHDNLKRYVGRMTARYYRELDEVAGCRAAA